MYYINPTNNPSNIHRWYLSKSIDICQLLLVTEGAFGKSLYEFEYKAEETKIEIVAIEKQRAYCDALVAKTEDADLRRARIIIDLSILRQPKFFQSATWTDKPIVEKEKCYRLNVLINSINSLNTVEDRCSCAEYCLFSERGYFFIKYLQFLLESIVKNVIVNPMFTTYEIVQLVNSGYHRLKAVYNDRLRILEDLRKRESDDYNYYNMLEESIAFNKWITAKSKPDETTMIGFIFQGANSQKKKAIVLMRQVIDILSISSSGLKERIEWENEPGGFAVDSHDTSQVLLKKISILRINHNKDEFEKDKWAEDYLNTVLSLQ